MIGGELHGFGAPVRCDVLDPLADAPVELAALGSRECRVDDVARQGVLEREFAHSRHAAVDAVGDEAAPDKRCNDPLLDLDGCRPEAMPNHAAATESIPRRGFETVDARRDHTVDRVRDRDIGEPFGRYPAAVLSLECPFLDQHVQHFLEVERIAFRACQHPFAHLLRNLHLA